MEITTGTIVKSLAGHDKEEVFFILREEGEYVYLVDGKYRTLDKPKKKNIFALDRKSTRLNSSHH